MSSVTRLETFGLTASPSSMIGNTDAGQIPSSNNSVASNTELRAGILVLPLLMVLIKFL